MTNPLSVSPDELGTYLNDGSIQSDRAFLMIELAQDLCESIVSPLPAAAKAVVMRVAARGYVTTTSSRAQQLANGGSPMGGAPSGGVYLTRSDKSDLRRAGGGGNVASVDMLPANFTAPALPPWDNGAVYDSDFDFPVTP